MQPLRAYHPQRYPPVGPRWVQFGDDIMGSATDEMRAMLERKNQWKRDFHIGRLQEQGMMPGMPHRASQPRRDPEDDAVDGFDRPTPSAPPPPESRRLESQTHSHPEHFDIGYDTAEEAEMPSSSSNGIISAISNGASNGANSLAADLGAGIVHSLAYATGAASAAVVKGGLNAVRHLATGRNPRAEPDPDEEEERSPDPPKSSLWGGGGIQNLKPKPKSSSWFGGSSGSQDKPSPHPYPAPWSPEAISAYNGGVHEVSSGEEAPAPGPVHPGPAPKRRGNRLAQRDVRYSQETLSRPEYQNLPRKRNGRN